MVDKKKRDAKLKWNENIKRNLLLFWGKALVSGSVVVLISLIFIYLAKEMTEGAFIKEYWWLLLITMPLLTLGMYLVANNEDPKKKKKKKKRRR